MKKKKVVPDKIDVISAEKLPISVQNFWNRIHPKDPNKKKGFGLWLKKELAKKNSVLNRQELSAVREMMADKTWRNWRRWQELETHLVFMGFSKNSIPIVKVVFKKWMANDPKAKFDGLSLRDVAHLRRVTRQVWSWSVPRKICLERVTDEVGFQRCEICKEKSPKVFVDHITPVGALDEGYFERLFVSSAGLQALCKKCHDAKTKRERNFDAAIPDFY